MSISFSPSDIYFNVSWWFQQIFSFYWSFHTNPRQCLGKFRYVLEFNVSIDSLFESFHSHETLGIFKSARFTSESIFLISTLINLQISRQCLRLFNTRSDVPQSHIEIKVWCQLQSKKNTIKWEYVRVAVSKSVVIVVVVTRSFYSEALVD